jgi:hypothetical protein
VEQRLSGVADEWLLALHASAKAPARRRIERYGRHDRAQAALLAGDDLVRLGLSGRSVGRVLARLRAAQLDGELRSRGQALARARALAARERA